MAGPFIASVSANGRYFLDYDGKPILLRADTARAGIVNAGAYDGYTWQQDMDYYCTTRAGQGFNAVFLGVIGTDANLAYNANGYTFDGVSPWASGVEGNLNATYWTRVDYFVTQAYNNNINVIMNLLWGDAMDAGNPMASMSEAEAYNYGYNVATRYIGSTNVQYMIGGNYDPSPDALGYHILRGVLTADANALTTVQNMPESTTNSYVNSSLILNDYPKNAGLDFHVGVKYGKFEFVYTYGTTYNLVQAAYSDTPDRPVICSPGHYDLGSSDRSLMRNLTGWALTSGSFAGINYGQNAPAWGWSATGWRTALANTAGNSWIHTIPVIATFSNINQFYSIVPDYTGTFITGGRGTKSGYTYDGGPVYNASTNPQNTYITGGRNTDGSLAIIYMPNGSQTVTLATAQMQSGYTVTWIDPVSGQRFAGTPGTSFQRTQTNSVGSTDWFLVLEKVQPLTPTTQKFATSISASGRYIQDQDGNPWMMKGDAPWAIIPNSSLAQQTAYLNARQTQGFNYVLVSLLGAYTNGCHRYDSNQTKGNKGLTYDDIGPFIGPTVGLGLNPAYWDRVEQFLQLCFDRNITVMVYPLDGWTASTVNGNTALGFPTASTTTCQIYGEQVGARLRKYPNVIVAYGGDEDLTNATTNAKYNAVQTGLVNAGSDRIFTVQPNSNQITMEFAYWKPSIDFSFVYNYAPSYIIEQTAYPLNNSGTVRPEICMEPLYETGYSTTPTTVRNQVGWALTSGSPGDVYGHEAIWVDDNPVDYTGALGAVHASKIRAAVEACTGWHLLVPDYSSTFITAGRQTKITSYDRWSPWYGNDVTSNSYVTGGKTANGSLAIIYIPNANNTITVATAQMQSGYTVRWVDPTNGTSYNGTPSTTFQRASANAAGGTDWLLILEGPPVTSKTADATATATAGALADSHKTGAQTVDASKAATATGYAVIASSRSGDWIRNYNITFGG
jgi:hypothetical protein